MVNDDDSDLIISEEVRKRDLLLFGIKMKFKRELREFEESLIHKLPNELRCYMMDYNYRNLADDRFLVDGNNYGCY